MSHDTQISNTNGTNRTLIKYPWLKQLRLRIVPPNSQREYELWLSIQSFRSKHYSRFFVGILKIIYSIALSYIKHFLSPRGVFAGEYIVQDHSQVILYTNKNNLYPQYKPRRPLNPPQSPVIPVTLITTLKNEKDNVLAWLESLTQQTRLPDEVIIVDGGSTDGTLEAIQDFAKHSLIPFVVISKPGANIAQGRNIAIEHSSYSLIASTDLGCQQDPNWLKNITAPFEDDSKTHVVAGWYEISKPSPRKMQLLGSKLEDVNPKSFLPSSRSIAFTKAAWEQVDGYPEWLSRTGEDTIFDVELKRACREWAFVPEAIVHWSAPSNVFGYWQKIKGWASGDGESLFGGRLYWNSLLRLIFMTIFTTLSVSLPLGYFLAGQLAPLVAAVLIILGIYISWLIVFAKLYSPIFSISEIGAEVSRVLGYRQGAQNHLNVLTSRYKHVKGFYFILAGVPIDDTGGGARCTQISLELLRQGYAVIYINRFPKYESEELNIIIHHPDLISIDLPSFNIDVFFQRYQHLFREKILGALIEFPLKEFLPIINKINAEGGVITYDLLDNWNSNLGGDWYSEKIEKEIIASSKVLVATEDSLAKRLESLTDRKVNLLPNAVNSYLFNPKRDYPVPNDLPAAKWTAIYIGALWGSWFDWDLLTSVAEAYPTAAIVAIGDYRGQCTASPSNLHFLGLKAQVELPAYLAHSDVALIPWHVNSITQATSPLKIYEYLAMHKPTVAPNLRPLNRLPGVFLTKSQADFISTVDIARQVKLPIEEIAAFVGKNDWRARVTKLLKLVELESQKINSQ